MDRDRIVIKKYANRRLYDTSNSRYINLEDIAALVRNGKDVQVVDANTGEDITRVTADPNHCRRCERPALRSAAGTPAPAHPGPSDRVGQEFIMWYLKSAFDAYSKVQSPLQTQPERDAVSCVVADSDDEELPANARAGKGRGKQRGPDGIAPAPGRTGGATEENAVAADGKEETSY